QLEPVELPELDPERPCMQAEAARDPHEVREGRALERQREAPPELAQRDGLAVLAGDHREAGEPALGRLRLEHGLRPAAAEHRSLPPGIPSQRGLLPEIAPAT